MKLIFNPSKMSKEEREHVAGFLLSFPAPMLEHKPSSSPGLHTQKIDRAAVTPSPEQPKEQSAEEAFGPATSVANSGPVLSIGSTADDAEDGATMQPVEPGSVTLDKEGLPHDPRIHASTRAITAEGVWRKKRGVDKTVIEAVEKELHQVMAAPAAPAPVATPAPSNILPMPTPPAPAPVAAVIPTATPMPTPPAPAPVAVAAVITPDFEGFKTMVSIAGDAVVAKKITPEELTALAATVQLPSFDNAAIRLDLVPELHRKLIELIASKG